MGGPQRLRLAAAYRRKRLLGVALTLALLVALNLWPGAIAAPPSAPTLVPTSTQAARPILYTFDLRGAFFIHNADQGLQSVEQPVPGKSYADLVHDYDLTLFVATLQGVVNRAQPRLYVYHAAGVDDYWLRTFQAPEDWLAGYDVVPLPDLETLLETFAADVGGTVVWDDEVPATLNVATTIAGVEDTPVIRRGSDLYDQITAAMPVKLDLSGRFSSKAEAYRWAVQEYLLAGRSNPRLLAYIEDGWPAVLYQRQEMTSGAAAIFARDYLVQNRGFVFDLSPWADEVPIDEPGQPLGQDRTVFEEILDAARGQAGEEMIAMWGFPPWWQKYSNSGGAGGSHEPVEGEWETVWLASSYGVYFTGSLGDVYGLDLANTSVHRFAPFPEHVPRPAAPTPDELRAQGLLQGGQVAPKTYLLYYMGDYDFAQPLYALMPDFWLDEGRGDLPLAWGINPQGIEIVPDILSYMLRTRTPADFFVAADSGAGYLNPEALPIPLRESWREHNVEYFGRLGLSITGFFLNGQGAEAPDEVIDLYRSFSPDGVSVNWRHLVGNWPRIQGNMPLTAFPHYGMGSEDPLESWIERVDAAYTEYRDTHGTAGPAFLTFRCVYTTPSFLLQLTEELRRLHPERDYQVVDPYTFFYLMREELGGRNERRATFLQPMLPQRATTGETLPLRLVVRNDGWEVWPAQQVGLGFTIAEASTTTEPPGASGDALFLPVFEDVQPGQVYTFTLLMGAPLRPGTYVVQYDLLQQPWQWFHEAGNLWRAETLEVEPSVEGMHPEQPDLPEWPTPAPAGPQGVPGLQSTTPPLGSTALPSATVSPPPLPADLPTGWDRPSLVRQALDGRAVWAVAYDVAGRVWFGGEQGVIAFSSGDDTTEDDDTLHIYTLEDGLPSRWVTAIAADNKGGVWFGTQGGGVAYLDQAGWTIYTEEDGLASNWVRAIVLDPAGRAWFATSKGVSAFSGTTWQSFNSGNSPLPKDVVTDIVVDGEGNLWFSTEGGGISRLSADGRDWHTYTTVDGLGDDFVLSLAVDAQSYIWAGTWRGGLSYFDGEQWFTFATANSGLAANWVQDVTVDARGQVWCGTYGLPGGGLSVLMPATAQWVHYGPADGLPSDNVTAVLQSRPGEVWVGTEMGAARYLDPLALFAPEQASPQPETPTPKPGPTRDPDKYSFRGAGEQGVAAGSLAPMQVTSTPTPLPSPTSGTPVTTPTRLPSPTPPASETPTLTPSTTPSPSPTAATATPSVTPSPTRTGTASPTPSSTPSPTGTSTATPTGTLPTATPTATGTPPTATPSPTRTATATPTGSVLPTPTSAACCCPPCPPPPAPPRPPPPLPTREENLDEVHTFTTSWGDVMRINARPSGNSLRVPETRAVGGRPIRVYVNADTLVWVAGIQLEISYDTNVLQAVGVNLTPRSDLMSRPAPVIETGDGKVNLLVFSPEGESIPPGRGPILSLLFEVREGVTDNQKAQIRIDRAILSDVDGNEVTVPAKFIYNGYLVICSTCFLHNGDVDKDGEVTILDVQRGVNIVIGRHIADDEEVVALDINGDDVADVLDVIKLVNLALGREEPEPWERTPTPLATAGPSPGGTASPTPTGTRGTVSPSPTLGTPGPTRTVPPTPDGTSYPGTPVAPGTPGATATVPTPAATSYPDTSETPQPTGAPTATSMPTPSPSFEPTP